MQKTVLITGASGGIGQAIAMRMANKKTHLLLHYNTSKAKAENVKKEVEKNGATAELLAINLQKPETIAQTLDKWQQKNPEKYIAYCINNAGIRKDNLLAFQSAKEWDDVLNINLKSAVNIMQWVIKKMAVNRFGRIVNMVSLSGLHGRAGQVNYSASKAGLIAATKSLSMEIARKKITVNAISPGFIKTAMTESLPEDELKRIIPIRRFGTPEEVAGIVAFLCTDEAAYITGETISVSGGL